jgi:2-alkenal reductase
MIQINSKLVVSLLVLSLAIVACAPVVSGPDGSEDVDTQETVEREFTEIRSEKTEGRETAPVLYEATPAVSLGQEAESLQDTLTSLYRDVNPSVVYIVVSSSSSGSGFVYDEEGHIVTNHHVATAGTDLEVVFAGGERKQATLVGADADSDLAVIKVDGLPDGVEPLPLAEADAIQVGQFAIAIGNPFGEQGSMSLGIVSGLGRSLRSQRETTAFSSYSLPQVIQTDAPINPGNSGGPLLNLEGQVIGVNAAIASTTGSNTGVGFSIPVAAVKRIVPDLIEKGEHSYAYMGASFDSEISLGEQTVYGVPQTQGAYVISVTPDGPADQAGLIAADPRTGEGGDLIVEIDGQPIVDFSDLNSYLVFETQVGQTIAVTVLRDGGRVDLPLTLGERPE